MNLDKNTLIFCSPNQIHNTYGFQIYLGESLSQKESLFDYVKNPNTHAIYAGHLLRFFIQGESENWIYIEYFEEPSYYFILWFTNFCFTLSQKYHLEVEMQ